MSRTAIWSAIAGLVLVTLATLWFLDNFERVPVKNHEGMKEEALRNPYLAAERLFSRLGRNVRKVRSPAALDVLGTGETLILERHRQRAVNRARADRLFRWVEEGGYLIVEREYAGDDYLLQKLGVSWYKPPKEQSETEEGEEGEEVPEQKVRRPADEKAYIDVALPDSDIVYRVSSRGRGLTASGPLQPEWKMSGLYGGDAILHFAVGRGHVTVLSRLDFMNNRQLLEHDHAEFASALLQRYQPGGRVHLAVRLENPTLWEWLTESAWMALISAGVMIVLWLWRVVPRFGGTCAAQVPARRDLAQHLLAIGRSLWREGGLGYLRNVVRRNVTQRLALRHPSLARRLSGERYAALAQLAGVKTEDIREALASESTPTPETFTRATQLLQRLEHKL